MEIPLIRTLTRMVEKSYSDGSEATARITNSKSISRGAPSNIINRDEFLILLLAQLKNQDPINSINTEEFTSQLVQFSTLDTILQQSESIDQVLNKVLRIEALGFLGKKVSIGNKVGVVTKITFENGVPKLWINGESYDVSLVTGVITDG
ncbi:MAG: flagellar hook capping FlgD N-terminal domain-containing protein [bacterium]